MLRTGFWEPPDSPVPDLEEKARDGLLHADEDEMAAYYVAEDKAFRVDQDGFKGPEIDPDHRLPRILNVGDSCTFGVGVYDYPTAIRRALNANGPRAEVVNGGVQGYAPKNVIYELDRYLALKPEIVTIYLGWNALFMSNPWPDAWENRLRSIWLAKKAWEAVMSRIEGHRARALRLRRKTLVPRRDDPGVAALDDYVPPFMPRIERIIEAFEDAGSQVVLVTLPGLFSMDEDPTPRALELGHLPEFTNNPFVLAKLTERYNDALRRLAKRRKLQLIDLAKWAAKNLRPRDAYFTDSVHMRVPAQGRVGIFMAKRLSAMIEDRQRP